MLDRDAEEINVVRQIRIVENKLVLAPPKRGKTQSVPLSSRVARELDAYAGRYEPAKLTLPWLHPGGKPATVRVYLVDYDRAEHARSLQIAGLASRARQGWCHLYAPGPAGCWGVDQGVGSVPRPQQHCFTLRVYTHLMPTSQERTAIGRRVPCHEQAVGGLMIG